MSLNYYLVLSTVLFFIGVFGVVRRKNLLMLFFSTEIMLNAVNIGFVDLYSFILSYIISLCFGVVINSVAALHPTGI